MTTRRIGVGAGGRDPEDWSNTIRLLIGEDNGALTSREIVIEANIADLDPRLLPGAIDALLAAGAHDAWITPILMKKGRPAHTLHALAPSAAADAVRRVFFAETSTIGVREHEVVKHALPRGQLTVNVDGHPIGVKVAELDGRVVNVQPEWDDVARAAAALGRPAIDVLAEAQAAALAARLVEPDS